MGQDRIDLEDVYVQSEMQLNAMASASSTCFLDIVGLGREARDASITPAGWVELLGADSFRVRQNASSKLQAMGVEKLPVLLSEINTTDPERQSRIVQILAKSYDFMNLKDVRLLGSPGGSFNAIYDIDDRSLNDPEIKKALKGFDPKLVDKNERAAIDDYFAGKGENVPNTSYAGQLYALQKVFENPQRQLFRFAFHPSEAAVAQLENISDLPKLEALAKKFPSLCESPAFLLKLQFALPDAEPGTQSNKEFDFVKKLPPPYGPAPDGARGAVSGMLATMRRFERSEECDQVRSCISEAGTTGNSDRLLLKIRANPALADEPFFLLSLLRSDRAVIDRIARGALGDDARKRFQEQLLDLAALYPRRR